MTCTLKEGDLVVIEFDERRRFVTRLRKGARTGSDVGVVLHDDVIGSPCGSYVPVRGGRGGYALVYKPSIIDVLEHGFRRATQVIYPKDSALIAVLAGVGPGARIVEVGTGSGFVTALLAWLVGENGHVYTYEVRREALETAKRNLAMLGLEKRVTFHHRDARLGILEENVDAVIVDMPDPWDILDEAYRALKPGGVFAAYTPSAHQLYMLMERLLEHGGFTRPRVMEVLLREWLPEPEALRPASTMIAHTGFITVSRKVTKKEQV
ncbi:Methyltransferase type 11 [Pyrolobus fumarii 1A]|uniref:Methyltransferase type 11 n=1 Tax=Pyrolobus fumarii (strain DSM 11204 / 1A) TaxID=694429 RepID=G0EDQ2_PYRF1|nr:tRNA (adenine-N1)-methyltransferase [Pyrolobus fumarii]AEM37889.1 Methyltransferase type 11 [Pyrolobus fumarii 1A]